MRIVEPKGADIAVGMLKGLKAMNEHGGKHKYIAKLAKFSDFSDDKLDEAVQKMTVSEKKKCYKAFSDINRVMQAIVASEAIMSDA